MEDDELMAGLIRVSPANNATYRQWWNQLRQLRQQAEMSRLSAVVEQYRVKAKQIKAAMQAMIAADEAMLDFSASSRRLVSTSPVIQLRRSMYFI
jgi:hypothetical protein